MKTKTVKALVAVAIAIILGACNLIAPSEDGNLSEDRMVMTLFLASQGGSPPNVSSQSTVTETGATTLTWSTSLACGSRPSNCYAGYAGGMYGPSLHPTVAMPKDGTMKNFYVSITSNSLNGSSVLYLIKNGVETTIASIPAGSTTTVSNTVDTVTYVAGDKISWRLDLSASSSGSAVIRVANVH